MENYIALLLLIVPGFIAYKMQDWLNDEKTATDSFEMTIVAMIYNVFILMISYGIMLSYGISLRPDKEHLQSLFSSDTNLIFKYVALTVFVSLIVGISWHFIKNYIFIHIVNFLRRKSGKNPIAPVSHLLDTCFNDSKIHLVEIIKDGNTSYKGFISGIYTKEREMHIKLEDVAKEDFIASKVKGTYFDFKNNIVIREYYMINAEYENERNKCAE